MCQPKKSSLWIMQFEIFSVKLSLICTHWTQPLPPSWFNLIKMQISHVVYQECKHWNKFLLWFNYELLSLLYKYHVCMTYVTSAVNRHFNVTSHCLFVIDTVMQYSAETYVHPWTHYVWMLTILVIITKTWHIQRMSLIYVQPIVCLSHVLISISIQYQLTGFEGSIAALRSSSSMFLLQSGQTHSGAC